MGEPRTQPKKRNWLALLERHQGWPLTVFTVVVAVISTEACVASLHWLMSGHVPRESLVVGLFAGLIMASIGAPLARRTMEILGEARSHKLATAAMRAQLQLHEAIEATEVVLWELDLASQKLLMDHSKLSWLGMDPEAKLDTLADWLALIYPEDRTPFELRSREALKPHAPGLRFEYRILQKDGSWGWLKTLGKVAERDAQGLAVKTTGGTSNITARKSAEIAYREARYRLQSIFENNPDALMINEFRSGIITEVNRAFELLSGHVRGDIIGRSALDFKLWAHPEDREGVTETLRRKSHLPAHDFVFVHKDGRLLDASLSCSLANLNGVPHVINTIQDISLRRAAEMRSLQSEMQALEAKGRLQALLDAMPDLLFEVDQGGQILSYHARHGDALRHPPQQFLGQRFQDLIPADAARICEATVQAAAQSGVATGDAYMVPMPSGPRWFEPTVASLPTGGTHPPRFILIARDMTERKQARDALAESEERYRTLIEETPYAIGVYQNDLALYVNPAAMRLLGAEYPAQLIGTPMLDRVHPDFKDLVVARYRDLLSQGHTAPLTEEKLLRLDGSAVDVEVQAIPISYNQQPAVLAVFQDITERKVADARLHLAGSVFSHAREGIMVTDAQGTIVEVNEAFELITGYTRDEVLGRNPRLLNSGRQTSDFYSEMWRRLQENGHWFGELWNRNKSGDLYAELLTISAVRRPDGEIDQYVALFSDISPLKRHEQQLERIAHFDALTGLPNRVLLGDRMRQAMAQTTRRGQRLAVAYLDLDGFKQINDRHGHGTGDRLLAAMATQMRQALREGDTLARLGGDEFVALLVDLTDDEHNQVLIQRLLDAASRPVRIGDQVLQVSASAGVTFYPQADEVDADQLLRQSDQAMYQAKLLGKNRWHPFDASHDRTLRGQLESIEHVRRGLARQEFVLHYQPKVNMRSGTVVGVEALLRWQHPERGLLLPGAFLPLIEDSPLFVELGQWVVGAALAQIERWNAAGLALPVSVNIGARHLQDPNFVTHLQQLLARHPGVPSSDLELEVLETSALDDIAWVSSVMAACGELGLNFALDDFGTGYSSLTYLKRLPVNRLKIDQSFVHDMLNDPDDLAILEGVISLASAFGRQVIAEGVECIEHGTMLLQLGCEHAQGFGIARPMPAADMASWVRSWRSDPSWIGQQPLNRDDLPLLFAGVEHRAWVTQLEDFLLGHTSTRPRHLDNCRLSVWLQGRGFARCSGLAAFDRLVLIHAATHQFGEQLCQWQAMGQSEMVTERLPELREQMLALSEALRLLVRELQPQSLSA